MKKSLVFLSLILCSAIQASQTGKAFVPNKLGNVAILHKDGQFTILQNNKLHNVESYNVDKDLRNLKTNQLMFHLEHGSLKLDKTKAGEFTIHSHVHGNGGGALGATIGCWVGKGAVYVGSYLVIGVASACTGPAFPITFAALTAAYALPIEAASQAGAVAGGVIGAVATGPV